METNHQFGSNFKDRVGCVFPSPFSSVKLKLLHWGLCGLISWSISLLCRFVPFIFLYSLHVNFEGVFVLVTDFILCNNWMRERKRVVVNGEKLWLYTSYVRVPHQHQYSLHAYIQIVLRFHPFFFNIKKVQNFSLLSEIWNLKSEVGITLLDHFFIQILDKFKLNSISN